MPKYKSIPQVVEAVQFLDDSYMTLRELSKIVNPTVISYRRFQPRIVIPDDFGESYANIGDYVVKDENGDLKVMTAEAFHRHYTKVEGEQKK